MMKRVFVCLFVLVLVLEGVIILHRIITLSFCSINGWVIDLDYCNVEYCVLEMNQDCCAVFETVTKYCILDSLVDYEG